MYDYVMFGPWYMVDLWVRVTVLFVGLMLMLWPVTRRKKNG